MNARIGRQVKHFKNIDVDNITATFSNDGLYRYTLQMQYIDRKEQNNTITVILKNPSSANEKMADNTIRRVENFVYSDLLPRINSWGSLVGFNPTRVAKPTTPTH